MNLFRGAFCAGLVIVAGSVLGCGGDSTEGMKNVKMENRDPVQRNLPVKKTDKPMPVDPPGPKAPPLKKM
jgi:hypothetical protein